MLCPGEAPHRQVQVWVVLLLLCHVAKAFAQLQSLSGPAEELRDGLPETQQS